MCDIVPRLLPKKNVHLKNLLTQLSWIAIWMMTPSMVELCEKMTQFWEEMMVHARYQDHPSLEIENTNAETPDIIPENLGIEEALYAASQEAPSGLNRKVCVPEPPQRSQWMESWKVQYNLSLGETQILVVV